MQREHRLLPLVICLIAGLAVSVGMIINKKYSMTSVVIILSVMLGFFIIGLIFRAILGKFKTKETKDDIASEELNEEQENIEGEQDRENQR